MKVFQVRLEPLDAGKPPAGAIVVAKNFDEAMTLLRKDINLSGYALPPAEVVPVTVDAAEVERVLGEDAGHEKGVYDFHLIGTDTAMLPST